MYVVFQLQVNPVELAKGTLKTRKEYKIIRVEYKITRVE